MTSGKRASMREGPLAALFRKTETEGLQPGAEPREDETARPAGEPASGAEQPVDAQPAPPAPASPPPSQIGRAHV